MAYTDMRNNYYYVTTGYGGSTPSQGVGGLLDGMIAVLFNDPDICNKQYGEHQDKMNAMFEDVSLIQKLADIDFAELDDVVVKFVEKVLNKNDTAYDQLKQNDGAECEMRNWLIAVVKFNKLYR